MIKEDPGGIPVQSIVRALIMLLFGLVLFAGLPLLAWGPADLAGFLGHPARLGYITLTALLQIFAVLTAPGAGGGRSKGRKLVRRQQAAVALMQLLSMAIMLAAPYGDRRGIGTFGGFATGRYLGLALFTLGFLIMHWAAAHLGRLFSVEVTIQEGHRLVTDGPYRYARHPRYLGIILFNLGFSLVFRSWLALGLTAALTLVLLWRIHDEEALMRAEFGKEWEEYAGRTARLVPFIY